MAQRKTFKISGEIKKPRMTFPFTKEVAATKTEDALEKIYAEFGSRHKAKRFQIKIVKIEEVKQRSEITS